MEMLDFSITLGDIFSPDLVFYRIIDYYKSLDIFSLATHTSVVSN